LSGQIVLSCAVLRRMSAKPGVEMRIIVLFNLKSGVTAAAYEAWALSTDVPIVRSLSSIAGFDVFKATGLLGSDARPPYAYIEIIDVADMDQFGQDIGTARMQAIAAAFQTYADTPVFITTSRLGADA
jgi:REDY-like protein HapK